METPDQDTSSDIGELEKEGLQQVLEVLRATAKRFRSLDQEAEDALFIKKDMETRQQKLREKAQLLIDLPNSLQSMLEAIKTDLREKIETELKEFSAEASEALRQALRNNNNLGLECLLIVYGSEMGDRNKLEELIFSLEK